jgi:uncharacterized protein YjbI with pentapeptide repeats
MANPDHVALLKHDVEEWNLWRTTNPGIRPKLSGADLSRAFLMEADLSKAFLSHANLSGAVLCNADLSEADLTHAFIIEADLSKADLSKAELFKANLYNAKLFKANLSGAILYGTDLSDADLSRANLSEADLREAVLVRTKFRKSNLTGCVVYGTSAWDVDLNGAIQTSLVITPPGVSKITVDDLEVAQFIYLLLNNKKVRHVIDTITSKVVLILGRFTPERKQILDAIREELRKRDYLTILFDFEKPSSKTTLETVSTLAHMARFVVADLTDARSVLQELQAIVPFNPSVPVQPIILNSQSEPGMFDFFQAFPWMLQVYPYDDQDRLIAAAVKDNVIGPAETRAKKMIGR